MKIPYGVKQIRISHDTTQLRVDCPLRWSSTSIREKESALPSKMKECERFQVLEIYGHEQGRKT